MPTPAPRAAADGSIPVHQHMRHVCHSSTLSGSKFLFALDRSYGMSSLFGNRNRKYFEVRSTDMHRKISVIGQDSLRPQHLKLLIYRSPPTEQEICFNGHMPNQWGSQGQVSIGPMNTLLVGHESVSVAPLAVDIDRHCGLHIGTVYIHLAIAGFNNLSAISLSKNYR